MAIEKSILREAIGNLRKDLRGFKGKSPVVVTIEHGSDDEPEPEGESEEEAKDEEKPDLLDKAMADLKGR
jgi:hypothetical protein